MINVREMQIDDLEKVMKIENESFSIPWTETGFFTFLIRDDTLFLVAEEDENILGYIGMVCVPEDGDITNVAVDEKCRNKGIGKLLVGGMIERSAKRGVKNIFLEVRVSNAPAIHLYESFGFENVGVRKNYYEEPKEDAYIMRRSQE